MTLRDTTLVNNEVTTQLSEQKIFFPAAGGPALKALPPADNAAVAEHARRGKGRDVATGDGAWQA
jgi:hypothetical protein